jgi:predicted metal-dependent phosphoesterase TrpH
MTARMGKADLHIHTREGDGLDTVEQIFDHVESRTDLDVIAVTEHDSLETALRARDLWARRLRGFDLIPGVEVTTLQGHIVALYLEEPVESLRPIEDTLDAVHRQDGVCFIPHPMSWFTRSIGHGTMRRVSRRRQAGLWFDGIELANLSPPTQPFLARARRLNKEQYGLPVVGASDAHFVQAIGSAYTSFQGSTADELRAAFATGDLTGHQACYPSLREVGLARAISVPIAGLGATPRRLGWRRTVMSFLHRHFE